MKIRLLRIFNLFRRDFLVNALTLSGIFFLFPLVILALTRTLVWWSFLGLLALNLIWFLTYLLGCPAALRIDGKTVEFSAYYEVRRGDHKNLHFTVTNIRQLAFRQTALERWFNVGRICFRGEAETEPGGVLTGSRSLFFQIAGIPRFRTFREKMEAEQKKGCLELIF